MIDAVPVRSSCGTVANPAVLVVTDWKSETWILSKSESPPNVRGLSYSQANMAIAQPKIKIRVAIMAILL